MCHAIRCSSKQLLFAFICFVFCYSFIHNFISYRYAVFSQQQHKIFDESAKPQCNGMDDGGITINGNELVYKETFNSHARRWGNVLATIWQARAMALFGGYSFRYESNWVTYIKSLISHTWIAYLPIKYPSIESRIDHAQFEIACHNCNEVGMNWEYPAGCHGAIDYIQDIIINETRQALQEWFEWKGKVIPEFGENDWYIYDRCADDTILNHPLYGPLRFRAMRVIDAHVENIYIVSNPTEQKDFPLCSVITESRINYLKRYYPGINIEFVGGEIADDFMKLVFAKNVIIAGQGSTFAYFATLANNGNVYQCKHSHGPNKNVMPMGLQSNRLYHFFNKKYGEALLPDNHLHIEQNQRGQILQWLNDEKDSVANEPMLEY